MKEGEKAPLKNLWIRGKTAAVILTLTGTLLSGIPAFAGEPIDDPESGAQMIQEAVTDSLVEEPVEEEEIAAETEAATEPEAVAETEPAAEAEVTAKEESFAEAENNAAEEETAEKAVEVENSTDAESVGDPVAESSETEAAEKAFEEDFEAESAETIPAQDAPEDEYGAESEELPAEVMADRQEETEGLEEVLEEDETINEQAALYAEAESLSVLAYGAQGTAVRKLQDALSQLGYLNVAPDGIFGGFTQRAVQKFQMYNGLALTGEADESMQELLYSGQAAGFSGVSVGSMGTAVYILQTKLAELGYLTVPADGVFGNYTKNAVLKFQKYNSLPTDGIAGRLTMECLFANPAAYSSHLPVSASVLDMGDSGKDVYTLQNRLTELGYLFAKADGVYGGFTQRAVKKFQMYNNYSITGTADADTLEGIFSENAASFTQLSKGSTGTAVYHLQEQLIALGYLSTAADGIFGSYTNRAMFRFQSANGIYADGVFGKYTAEALFNDPQPYDPDTADDSLAMQMTRQVLDQIGWDLYKAFIYSVQLGEVFNAYLTDATTSEAVVNGLYSPYVDCVRAASVFCYFARNMGYDAWVVSGVYLMTNGAYGDHAWCRIVVNGDTLNCDPTRGLKGYMFHYGDPGTLRYTEYEIMRDY